MAQVYTPGLISSYQSYLQNPGHVDTDNIFDILIHNNQQRDLGNYYFQILIFEDDELDDDKPPSLSLIWGQKTDLINKYFGGDENKYLDNIGSEDQFLFPTNGVNVDTEFVEKSETEYSTIYFLLQSRKLSQLLAYTWLDDNDIRKIMEENVDEITNSSLNNDNKVKKIKDAERKLDKIEFVRKILNSYNILPDTYYLNPNTKQLQQETRLELRKELLRIEEEEKDKEIEIEKKIIKDKEIEIIKDKKIKKIELLDFYLIKPESQAFGSISLALLLSGNAYYKDQNTNKMIRIQEPILSNYEIVWDHALEMSWDTFFTTKEDVSQAGKNPKPPYHKMIIGYPPKPYEFSGGSLEAQKALEDWATADDHYKKGGPIQQPSFYPRHMKKGSTTITTAAWDNKKVNCVLPPYHYIPVTCG